MSLSESVARAAEVYEKHFGSRFVGKTKERTIQFLCFLTGWEMRTYQIDIPSERPSLSYQELGYNWALWSGATATHKPSYDPTIYWTPYLAAYAFFGEFPVGSGSENLPRFVRGYTDGKEGKVATDSLISYMQGYRRGELASYGILPVNSGDAGKNEGPIEVVEPAVESRPTVVESVYSIPQYKLAHILLDQMISLRRQGNSNGLIRIMADSLTAVVSTIPTQES